MKAEGKINKAYLYLINLDRREEFQIPECDEFSEVTIIHKGIEHEFTYDEFKETLVKMITGKKLKKVKE